MGHFLSACYETIILQIYEKRKQKERNFRDINRYSMELFSESGKKTIDKLRMGQYDIKVVSGG
jgi:hypothetical protein